MAAGTVTTDDERGAIERRALLRCAALGGLAGPLLVACGSDSEEPSAGNGDATTPESPDTGSGGGDGGSKGLVAAADVPVGGGVALPDQGIVVTQPTEGEFVGYTSKCTHQGGNITAVSDDGVMTCSLHGSQFSIEDGANLVGPNGGPAGSTADLPTIEVEVVDGQVVRG
jgi:nitrite reductase/ring-hydroxylating ferredoxin subunit